jgi:uncharacterized protein
VPMADKFVVDRMLGRLAKALRMLGYDTIYYRGNDPEELLRMARLEGRLILTRPARHSEISTPDPTRVLVKEDRVALQLRELLQTGILSPSRERLFSRCLRCNAPLDEIPCAEAEGRVPEFVFHHVREFFQCPECHRIYWKGSHPHRMRTQIEDLIHPSEEA